MKNKFIALSDQEHKWVEDEAKRREITFSDMIRRIIDDRYEKQEEKEDSNGKS
jgi:hypothetical protein